MIPTHERIPRHADCLQWDGNNTQAVMDRLAQHGMIGELFRDIHIQVYKDGSYSTTVNVGSWLVEGEDGKLRFYDDETHALMYRPISDELERLRACLLEIITLDCPGFQAWQKACVAEKYGITEEYLKAHE